MEKSKRLEDATKGDFLFYLQSISYFVTNNGTNSQIAEIRLIPSGSVLEIVSIYRTDRKSTRLNSSHVSESRMPSSA